MIGSKTILFFVSALVLSWSAVIQHKAVVMALSLPSFFPTKLTHHATSPSSKESSLTSSSSSSSSSSLSRRGAIERTVRIVFCSSAVILGGTTTTTSSSYAFENHIDDYAKYTEKNKRRGTPPKDLGIRMRTTEGKDDTITEYALRSCDGNPNCFSTTGDYYLEDRQQYGTDYFIEPWIPPPVDVDPKPFQTLIQVVKGYKPGQGGIDGGGFGIIEETDSYLYVQFESLKKGYIDDVEFATVSGKKDDSSSPGKVLVRSASRVGFTDFGVNAIRLNYIASELRTKGWSIADITRETHRDYWDVADEARQATFDPDRRQMSGV